MNSIELIKPEPQHLPELGRICFEAFRTIHDHHNFSRDFPDIETAVKVISLMGGSPGVFGIAAHTNGRLIGSNFLLLSDSVGGVGPITIDPSFHGQGVGRRLMQAVLDHAAQRAVTRVRLMQDSFNTASLSLYASLGFDVRESVAVMKAPPATATDSSVRLADESDFPALAELGESLYKVNRSGELRQWSGHGIPILVRESRGIVQGYLMPGKLGHGVAETEADALALIGQISAHAPQGMDKFFLPLRLTSFYRAALRSGCRLIKVMTLMTRGPYEEPDPVWMPSVLY